MLKSASSDPSSDKRSDDDDDVEEEKVDAHAEMHTDSPALVMFSQRSTR